MNRCAL